VTNEEVETAVEKNLRLVKQLHREIFGQIAKKRPSEA
jgi:hypothetical protein